MNRTKQATCRASVERTEALPGGRVADLVYEGDPDSRPVTHHRVVDTLGRMLRAGTIDQAMHDAARDFQAAFTIAAFDQLRALPLARVTGSGGAQDLTGRQVDARRRIHAAVEAVGGLASPGGSALWYVVGLEHSIREWALRQGWGGRTVEKNQAQGILVAALGMLAHHFGHRRPETAGSRKS
ncbi:MAG: hypothetical protein GC191_21055 [Azospirillum sp.]|nr:hypothetical protein [Azospirillum sp.]